jgi:hypothetical protein
VSLGTENVIVNETQFADKIITGSRPAVNGEVRFAVLTSATQTGMVDMAVFSFSGI